MGIWIPRGDVDDGSESEQDPESEEEDVDDNGNENDTHSTRSEDSELDDVESDGGRKVGAGLGRFDVLAINESDDEQDESEILS